MERDLKSVLSFLADFIDRNEETVVLVEGKRDKAALERFGIERVVELKGKRYHDVAEELAESYSVVVLLTDFDPEGEEIFRKLSRVLSSYGLKVDSSVREALRETGIKFIEKIPYEVLRRRNGGV